MSLTPEDLDMVREAERETFGGVSEEIEFMVPGSGTIDSYSEIVTPSDPRWVSASGTVSVLREGDALLGMSGKLQVGDYVAKFYYPDVVSLVDVQKVRRASSNEVFTVEMRLRTGLGPTYTRLELGLKRKPNED
jgi:hypothetical protein